MIKNRLYFITEVVSSTLDTIVYAKFISDLRQTDGLPLASPVFKQLN
jgi:hypothetical protein